jgi:hypothetical protein
MKEASQLANQKASRKVSGLGRLGAAAGGLSADVPRIGLREKTAFGKPQPRKANFEQPKISLPIH